MPQGHAAGAHHTAQAVTVGCLDARRSHTAAIYLLRTALVAKPTTPRAARPSARLKGGGEGRGSSQSLLSLLSPLLLRRRDLGQLGAQRL
jgi:hypothetical protein